MARACCVNSGCVTSTGKLGVVVVTTVTVNVPSFRLICRRNRRLSCESTADDLPRNPHTHTVYSGRLLVSAGGLTQLSAAAIASFPFVCVLAGSIQNGKPLYCGKLGVSVYPPGALKSRRLTGMPWCCA